MAELNIEQAYNAAMLSDAVYNAMSRREPGISDGHFEERVLSKFVPTLLVGGDVGNPALAKSRRKIVNDILGWVAIFCVLVISFVDLFFVELKRGKVKIFAA